MWLGKGREQNWRHESAWAAAAEQGRDGIGWHRRLKAVPPGQSLKLLRVWLDTAVVAPRRHKAWPVPGTLWQSGNSCEVSRRLPEWWTWDKDDVESPRMERRWHLEVLREQELQTERTRVGHAAARHSPNPGDFTLPATGQKRWP